MKSKWLQLVLAAGLVATVVLFQNCQPIGTVAETTSLSQGSGGRPPSPTPGPGGGPSPTPTPTPGGPKTEGQLYYEASVLPMMQLNNRCTRCHNAPRFITPPNVIAPTTITEYTAARIILASGANTALGNNLISRASGAAVHTGGNQCVGGVSAADPVCGPLIMWFQKEFPTSPSGQSGAVSLITEYGRIDGYAFGADRAQKQPVFFYKGGPVGTGTLVGQTTANITQGFGLYDGNYFTFQMPAATITNTVSTLYVYIGSAVAANLMAGTGPNKSFAAYKPTANGRTYFDANVAPRLNMCAGCHAWDYGTLHAAMATTPPFHNVSAANNGTATNNNLINNAAGVSVHGGGNVCGGINGGVCANFQQWWALEFAPQ